jgi:hypothetical protein
MSTDFEIVCDVCKVRMHAGQIMAMVPSFGYSSDDGDGHRKVAAFAFEHAYHGDGARIVVSNTAEEKRSDGYRSIEYDYKPVWTEDYE